jgi:hypothetical protein
MSATLQNLSALKLVNYTMSIDVQGDDAPTASRIKIEAHDPDGNPFNELLQSIRVRTCNDGTHADSTNGTLSAANGSTLLETLTANKDLVISNVPATAAGQTLTISGVVLHGETVTVNGDLYTFDATAAQGSSGTPVDITGGTNAQSTGTLTVDTQPTIGDTMTIGTRTYSFVADGDEDVDGEISIGTDLATAQANIVAAINGTDHNTANTLASAGAFAANASTITNLIGGVIGDSTVTTETFFAGTNIFGAGTLSSGADTTAAEATVALAAAITANASAIYSATSTATTVPLTADTAGAAGNSITVAETMALGAFVAGGVFTGGYNLDSNTFYVEISNSTAADVETIRIGPALGSPMGDFRAIQQLTTPAA